MQLTVLEAIRLDGDQSHRFYLSRAGEYLAKGDCGRAHADCDEVVRFYSEHPSDQKNLRLALIALEASGDIPRDIGEHDQAIDDYGKSYEA